jgi:hypothetical protein
MPVLPLRFMLRQESGTDKTNIVARTSKVILADQLQTSVELQSSNCEAKLIGSGTEAYLYVQADSKRGLQEFREIPAIPHWCGYCYYIGDVRSLVGLPSGSRV